MKFGNLIKKALYAGCAAALVTGFAAGSAGAASTVGAPDQSVGQLTTQDVPKGQPPLVGPNIAPGAAAAPQVITTPADGMFQYAQASQFVLADGARGYFTIPKPVLAQSDSHSPAELAVQSSRLG